MGLLTSEISTKKMVPLCRQIATSYDSGIPILRTLEIVSNQLKDAKLRGILAQMHDDIRRGKTLAEAAQGQSKYFPPVFINLLAGGEQGGKLDAMLRDLADYYEDRLAMRREIIRMMIYPMIQIGAAWFLGTFALRLLPALREAITGRGQAFNIEAYFADYALFQGKAAIVAAVAVVVAIVLSRMGIFQYISGVVKTFIWPVSYMGRNFAMARFYRSMSLLTGAGINILKCIANSAAAASNPYIEKDLLRIIPPVQHGAPLAEAFHQSKYVDQVAREMIRVGEESGRLESQFRKASEYAMERAKHAADIATKVLSTVVLLAVAGVIGYIVISFWTTYFDMLRSF